MSADRHEEEKKRHGYVRVWRSLHPLEARQKFLLAGLCSNPPNPRRDTPGGDLGSRLSGGLHGTKRGFSFVSLV